jgi:hypothetical protein
MAIVELTKRNSGDGVDRKKGETQAFEDRQTEEWDIVVSEAGYSSSRILAEAALPAAYSPHPDNPNLRCTGEHQVRRVDGSPIHFVAIVTYDTPPPGSPLPDPEAPPDEKKPQEREREPYSEEWSTAKSQEQIDVDVNGDPIVTVNGEQFDPPITEDVHDIQVTFGQNVDNRNQALIDAAGCTNSDVFLGYAPGQCMIDQVQFKYLSDPNNGASYWRQTATVLIRRTPPNNPGGLQNGDLWKKRIRAEGYKIKVAGDDTPRNAKDGEGNPSAVPVLHDAASGELIEDPKQAQWYYFRTRGEIAFQPLNID